MRLPALALLAVLCGCVHSPVPVQDMGNGQYSLSASSESGGVEGGRESAVERANAYCGRSGQQPVIASFYDHGTVGVRGSTSTIIFSCAAPRVLHFYDAALGYGAAPRCACRARIVTCRSSAMRPGAPGATPATRLQPLVGIFRTRGCAALYSPAGSNEGTGRSPLPHNIP